MLVTFSDGSEKPCLAIGEALYPRNIVLDVPPLFPVMTIRGLPPVVVDPEIARSRSGHPRNLLTLHGVGSWTLLWNMRVAKLELLNHESIWTLAIDINGTQHEHPDCHFRGDDITLCAITDAYDPDEDYSSLEIARAIVAPAEPVKKSRFTSMGGRRIRRKDLN